VGHAILLDAKPAEAFNRRKEKTAILLGFLWKMLTFAM